MRDGAQQCHDKAYNHLEVMTEAEALAWKEHPITQALKETLQGDFLSFFEQWGAGNLTGETIDQTVQQNARAVGHVQAIESVVEWIERPPIGEDQYD